MNNRLSDKQQIIALEDAAVKLKKQYLSGAAMLQEAGECGVSVEDRAKTLREVHIAGLAYFNHYEMFVGSSDLLGAHHVGNWIAVFAESCHSVLETVVNHYDLMNRATKKLNLPEGTIAMPSATAYASMQRMVKRYIPKEAKTLCDMFEEAGLPSKGFNDLKRIPNANWERIVSVCFGIIFMLFILIASIAIAEPTKTQFFIFRLVAALSAGACAAFVPGFIRINYSMKGVAFRAGCGMAIFILVYLFNSPPLE